MRVNRYKNFESHYGKTFVGFTLIEVLIALAVIAIALTAMMQNFGQGVETTIALRERTIAMWVAQNRLAEHYASPDWPAPDTYDGTEEMAGRTWRWHEQVSTTPGGMDIRRIEIEIRTAPDREVVAHLIGFVAKKP